MATAAAQRARLESMLQVQSDPVLTTGEVDTLFALARRPDGNGTAPDDHAEWTPSTALVSGAVRVPAGRNGYVYRATVGGTTGAVAPAWPTVIGQTVADGGVTWRCEAAAPWNPTYNLYASAAEGWAWKAGKLASRFDLTAGNITARRSQAYQGCLSQARFYRERARGGSGGVASALVMTRYTDPLGEIGGG